MAKTTPLGASSAELTVTIETARRDQVAAEAAVASAIEAYESNLLDDTPEESRKRFDAKTTAAIAVDRAAAMVRALEKRLATAIESEAADHRAQLVATARKKSEAARRRLESEYAPACETIRSLLREIAEADVAVLAANDAALDGEQHLPRTEEFRSQANLYREQVNDEIVDLWVAAGALSTPISDDLQRRVSPGHTASRGGWSDAARVDDALGYGVVQQASGPLHVVKRRFRKRSFLPNQTGHRTSPLAEAIELPTLFAGGTAFWEKRDRAPQQIIADLDRPRIDRPANAERVVEHEYSLVGGA